jgi:hypothetical protein
MKKHLLVLGSLLLAAAVSRPALAAEESPDPTLIRLTARPYIERGMSRETVREMAGAPSAQLSADVWVYFDVKASNAVPLARHNTAALEKHDTLVVAFKDNRVSLVRACDSAPVRAFIAQEEKKKQAAPLVAAK